MRFKLHRRIRIQNLVEDFPISLRDDLRNFALLTHMFLPCSNSSQEGELQPSTTSTFCLAIVI